MSAPRRWCPSCDGAGWTPDMMDGSLVRCPDCAGSGLAENSISANEARTAPPSAPDTEAHPVGWVHGDAFVDAMFWTDDNPPKGWAPVYATPTSAPAGVEGLVAEWDAAYRAFKGAFDTPLSRKRQSDEYAEDARDRLAAIDKKMRILAQQPAAVGMAWQVQLADALDCFWNAAIEGSGRDRDNIIGGMVQGFAAVATRLRELAAQPGESDSDCNRDCDCVGPCKMQGGGRE